MKKKFSFTLILSLILYQYISCIENCEKTSRETVRETYCYKKCSKKILGVCSEHDTVCQENEKQVEVCEQCLYGYVVINGNSCVKGIDKCFIHEENKSPLVCLECEDDYTLLLNKCIPYIEGCLEYSESSYLC